MHPATDDPTASLRAAVDILVDHAHQPAYRHDTPAAYAILTVAQQALTDGAHRLGDARALTVAHMAAGGMTRDQVGRRVGLSQSRVGQLVRQGRAVLARLGARRAVV